VPPKISGDKLTKVVSTKISDSVYTLLTGYAKEYYLQGKVRQPNLSQLLTYIITDWLHKTERRKASLAASNRKPAEAPSTLLPDEEYIQL
jgi:hypothetical protein